jgi:Flp pilus assembly protein TadG
VRACGDFGRRAAQWTKRFIRSTGGNVAMIFGLASASLVMAGGVGLDMTRAELERSRLSAALDAAALAVGTTDGLSQSDLEVMAQRFFDANYATAGDGDVQPVTVMVNGETTTLAVRSSMPTTLLRIMHIDELDLGVTNQVVRGANLHLSQ